MGASVGGSNTTSRYDGGYDKGIDATMKRGNEVDELSPIDWV